MNGHNMVFMLPFVNGLLPSGCGLLSLACSACKQKVVPSKQLSKNGKSLSCVSIFTKEMLAVFMWTEHTQR